MASLLRTIRIALSQRGFSAIVVLTIALTIGAATAVFSLFDAALLRPFPYRQPDRLVRIETFISKDKGSAHDVSYYDFDDYRRRSRTIESMAAYMSWSNPLTGMGPAKSVRMTFVSASVFELLGVAPAAGRVFTAEEDVYGGPVLKAVISHGLWQDLFGGLAEALGRTIQLRGQSYEVIGVMPPGFAFPDRSQVWVPIMARYSSYKDTWWKRRDARIHRVIARLRPGVSVEQASADIASIAQTIRSEHPEQSLDAHGRVISLRDAEAGEAKPYVHLVAGAALLLLTLGCLNVANLMIARATARERETAIRLALGAGARQVITQQLGEAAVLSAGGAAAGMGIAWLGVHTFLLLLPVDIPGWMRLELDWRVVAFATGAAVVTTVVASMVPAIHQLRTNAGEALKQGARGSTGASAATLLVRRGLVVSEVALSLVLLAGAGLMVRSFQSAMKTESGIRPDNLIVIDTGRFVPNVARESAVRVYSDVYRRVQLALGDLPGVVSASGSHSVPFTASSERRSQAEFYTLRRATRDQAHRLPSAGADIMPGYFETMGIPLLDGRDFNEEDGLHKPPVVIISQRTAEALYPGERAVGQKIRFGIDVNYDPWSTVIGVVGNARYNAAEREPGHEIYWSYRQYPGPGIAFVVRTATDPTALLPRIKTTIQSVDPDIAIDRMTPMTSLIAESIWRRRMWAAILSVFGAMALVLAVVGLYGLMSYLVTQQRKEIGIRMAIGAQRGQVLGWMLWRGVALSVVGLAVGLALLAPISGLLSDLLFGIPGHDPLTHGAAALMLLGAAITACAVPAVRASRTDPVIALRGD